MTIQEENQQNARSYKLMLLFGMVSMFMVFAGLTSAYIVSASRKDWIHTMIIPPAFTVSTILILISSVTIFLANVAIKHDKHKKTTLYLYTTLVLGLLFVYSQFVGFKEVIAMGYFFTGSESSVTSSFLYVLTILHLVHLAAGIISLLVVIYNNHKHKYNSTQSTGLELAGMFWHFLDFVWVYIFLFLFFVK